MKLIENISQDAIQRHTIITDGGEIVLVLRYFPVTQHWTMGVTYKEKSIDNVKLSLGVQHIDGMNWPFDFVVVSSELEVDPFQLKDFSSGRCLLYMLEANDVEAIRGYSVQL